MYGERQDLLAAVDVKCFTPPLVAPKPLLHLHVKSSSAAMTYMNLALVSTEAVSTVTRDVIKRGDDLHQSRTGLHRSRKYSYT